MKICPTVKLLHRPRMADFAKWGVAITKALDFQESDFLEAYQKNIKQQNDEVIEGNLLAQAVLMLMNKIDRWEGTVKEAYGKLKAAHDNLDLNEPTFPRHCNKLRKHLNRIKPNLEDQGIVFHFDPYHAEKGTWMGFARTGKGSSVSSGSSDVLKTNGFKTDDRLKIPVDRSKDLQESNHLKSMKNEDHVDPEDQIHQSLELNELDPRQRESFEERAAIKEIDSDMSREEAEESALSEIFTEKKWGKS